MDDGLIWVGVHKEQAKIMGRFLKGKLGPFNFKKSNIAVATIICIGYKWSKDGFSL